ncbi:MAG: type II toxin-antitoxin system PemK/MazF family toxin [Sideroxydans sp.]|nr:type II toxin-antitoxin system PemK/MazF family toxin [Sideroxydans sp.]
MKQAGQIVLTAFPYTDLSETKLRPVLLLKQASHTFDDWLVCMVSSQIHQADAQLDEVVRTTDKDFIESGLKADSVLRLSRLAVLNGALLVGSIGKIDKQRLTQVKQRLANWIIENESSQH